MLIWVDNDDDEELTMQMIGSSLSALDEESSDIIDSHRCACYGAALVAAHELV